MPHEGDSIDPVEKTSKSGIVSTECPGNRAYNALLDATYIRILAPQRMGDLNSLKSSAPCLKTERQAIERLDQDIKRADKLGAAHDITIDPLTVEPKGTRELLPPFTIADSNATVNGETIPEGTTYIKVNHFDHYSQAMQIGDRLMAQNASGTSKIDETNSIILDLRDNRGGSIPGLQRMASLLVGDSNIQSIGKMSAENLLQKEDSEIQAYPMNKPYDGVVEKLKDKNIIVLTGPETAGGAESLADALREKRQAKILGTQTYGLGSFYVSERMGYASITYPAGKMFGASGRWLGEGIVPDIQVDNSQNGQNRDIQLKAAIDILKK